MGGFSGDRLDWSEIHDRVDLAAVATSLIGPAPGRRGGKGRLWWKCPFHDDKNPSFQVNPIKKTWTCYACNEHGDAAALVMKLKHCTFPEPVAHLAGKPAPSGKPTRPRPLAASPPGKAAASPAKEASGLPLADALKLVEEAAARIWTPEGGDALAYLRGRGLTEATIKAARLGWTPRVSILPVKDGDKVLRMSRGSSFRGLTATALRWSRSAGPRGARPSTPKHSATAPCSIRPPRSFALANRL